MFNRAQDQGGVRRPTAGVLRYVEDWPPHPNADIESEGAFWNCLVGIEL